MAELPPFEQECFFIAPIGDEGGDVRKRSDGVLKYIVARAAREVDLVAVRSDQIAKPGQITLQVIEHVLQAKAAVADLTSLNPNVFYELAIRHTAQLPIVLIAEAGEKLPFDIAQMRTIFFTHTDLESADRCREELAAHLREALRGPSDSPIATALDVSALRAGSTVERSIADIVTSVEELTGLVRENLDETHRLRRRPPTARRHEPALTYAYEHAQRALDAAQLHGDHEVVDLVRDVLSPLDYVLGTESPRFRAGMPLDSPRVARARRIEKASAEPDAESEDEEEGS
jgi:hypothetical protein